MNADQLGGPIFSHLHDNLDEYKEFQHSPATIAGMAAEGLEAWLKQEGLAIIKIGDVPPWMECASNSSCDCPEANGPNRDCFVCDVEHFRMKANS